MHKCSACGNEFSGHQCPNCGGKPLPSTKQINESLKKYSYLLLAGLFGNLAAVYVYPLLDINMVLRICLCVFFLPIIFHLVSGLRKRLAFDAGKLKKAYLISGLTVAFLAALIAANGALDNSISTVRSSILRKNITKGRYSTTHHLIVVSWRPGRRTEDLWVAVPIYAYASIGQSISVEVHKGLLGLPWYGKILLE